MKKIRVCFYVFFPGGGIGRYTHELARTMGARDDVFVEVVCTPEFQWEGDEAYVTWRGLRSISHPVPTLRRTRFLFGQFVNPLRCIRHAVETGADVLHFSNVNHLTFPLWKRALERSKIPIAISVHDVRRKKTMLSRAWEDRQLKAVYRYASALFVHSEYQAEELIDFAGIERKKVHVVPHGPYPYGPATRSREEMRDLLGIPQGRQVALFFGQLRDEKGLDRLLRAIASCDTKPHLVVAGSGGGRHHDGIYYRTLAEKLGISAYVTFIDRYIEDEEVGDLFEMSDWVALPYRKDFTSQSGVLNVAASYKRPVLVTNAPVLAETVSSSGIGVVSKGDFSEAIALGIKQIINKVDQVGTDCFSKYMREYSWEQNARRTLKFLRKMIDAKNHHFERLTL